MCENEEHVICSLFGSFFFDSFSFFLCGSRNIHEFYCVSHKNFLFNSDLAINFKKIRICGIPCIIESNSTPTEPHKMLCAFSVSSCHILFFVIRLVNFCSFVLSHMISPVAIVRLSLWCQSPMKILVSFRHYTYILFLSVN